MPQPSADAARFSNGINLILYGPSGTGKTHWLHEKSLEYSDAVEAADEEGWRDELLARYGWRAVIAAALAFLGNASDLSELSGHTLIMAKARQHGRTPAPIQSTLLGYLEQHTLKTAADSDASIRRAPFIFSTNQDGTWELQSNWEELDKEAVELVQLLKVGEETGAEPVGRFRFVTFYPAITYADFVGGIQPVGEAGIAQFRWVDGPFKQICDEARKNPGQRHALLIDEIGSVDLGQVLGALVRLIEPGNRAVFDPMGRLVAGATMQLSGCEDEPPFAVPANLDIFGTMNTTDWPAPSRQPALRSRFDFKELEPDYDLLNCQIGSVNLAGLLKRLNDRIEYLLDRDHRIGHGFFIAVKSFPDLRRLFSRRLIPLLQEYFRGDLSRVAMVLSTGPTGSAFIERTPRSFDSLFDEALPDGIAAACFSYTVTDPESWTETDFRAL